MGKEHFNSYLLNFEGLKGIREYHLYQVHEKSFKLKKERGIIIDGNHDS
jgi:hypothetical protein